MDDHRRGHRPNVGHEPVNINVGPLASFALSNPGTPTAGMPFNETITALDAGGNTVTSFGGTGGQAECLTFTGPHNSPNGTAPTYPGIGGCPSGSSVTFTNGVGTARITLSDAETTSLRATAAFITGVWTGFTVNPAGASAFALATPSPGAGIGFSETVTATDAYGNTATSYGGTGGLAECLTFTGPHNSPNGTAPTYPAKAACVSGSSVKFTSGIGAATMTLYDAQTTTLTATTTTTPTLTGTSSSFAVATGALNTLTVANPGTQTQGNSSTSRSLVWMRTTTGSRVRLPRRLADRATCPMPLHRSIRQPSRSPMAKRPRPSPCSTHRRRR